jgi:CRP-like cAMP-binding protein
MAAPPMIRIMSAEIPELAGFAPELLRRAQALHRPAGSSLFRAGQRPAWMYYVRTGEAVMQRVTTAGAPVLLQRASAGFIAEASLVAERYHCDGVCRSACDLLALPLQDLRAAIDADAATRWAWIRLLSTQARQQRARIERHTLKSIRERLQHLVLTEGKAGVFHAPATRVQLAAELGVTPEALYRCLRSLQDAGELRVDGRKLAWVR